MGNNCCNNILLCGILNSSFLRLYATVIASTIPDYSSLGNNRVAKISMGAQFHTSEYDSGGSQSQLDTYPIVLFPYLRLELKFWHPVYKQYDSF